MPAFFQDALHDQLGTWPLAYAPYGGADVGEIVAIGQRVADGDDTAFHDAWTEAARRLMQQGETALQAAHVASARECFLKAAGFFAKAYHPLFGEPLDPRVPAASARQDAAFSQALALGAEPALPLCIPFDGVGMPAYVIPAQGRADEVRPLLILTNGYDGTITDLYFASAVAASRRGYHCLIFDGPGQGRMLVQHARRLRPDWESVIHAVVDGALALPIVDPRRIALAGWSLGGYLAPRAASGEPRLAACIADPPQFCPADGFRAVLTHLGVPAQDVQDLGRLDAAWLARLTAHITADRRLRWSIIQRGFWVHGKANLGDYLAHLETFTLAGRMQDIRCPTLVTCAQDDPLAQGAQAFFDALTCNKTLLPMNRDEGAGAHCEMGNRSLLNRKVLDWLDDVLA